MPGSGYGTIFRLTSFGESHGVGIGGVIEGVPAGFKLDLDLIQKDLDRRRPGQSHLTTSRNEEDKVEFLSGLFEGKTTGTPVAFIIRNKDHRSADYSSIKNSFRPSHADKTYEEKYGFRDYRGGGRASARETIARVVAGAIAKQFLSDLGVSFSTYVDQIGNVKLNDNSFFIEEAIEANLVRCPDAETAAKMEQLIEKIQKEGDTVGGAIRCVVMHPPKSLGEPVFDKLHAEIGKAMLSINAVKGFEFGSGFESVAMKGSEHNDLFLEDGNTQTNHSGGIQGGISNGMPIYFRVAFKPVATIMQPQETVGRDGQKMILKPKGRHDACVVPRAVPIVEAMTAMVLFDMYLRTKANQW